MLVGKRYIHGSIYGEALLFLKTGQAGTDENFNSLSHCIDLMCFRAPQFFAIVPPSASAISSSTYNSYNNSPQQAVR